VGDVWEEPDSLLLNPLQWIKDSELFLNQKELVKEILDAAFEKARTFITRFQPLLEIYWRSKLYDLSILVHEQLRNPTDNLAHTINLFQYQDKLYLNQLPTMVELGLVQVDSRSVRSKLLPVPKKMIVKIEEIVPVVIRERTDQAKKWLRDNIRELQRQVTTVEDFVQQSNSLAYANDNFQGVRDKVGLYG